MLRTILKNNNIAQCQCYSFMICCLLLSGVSRERTHKIDDFMSRFVTSNFFPLSSGQDSNVSSFLDVLVRVVNDFLEDYAMDMLKLDAMHGKYMMPNEKKNTSFVILPPGRKVPLRTISDHDLMHAILFSSGCWKMNIMQLRIFVDSSSSCSGRFMPWLLGDTHSSKEMACLTVNTEISKIVWRVFEFCFIQIEFAQVP